MTNTAPAQWRQATIPRDRWQRPLIIPPLERGKPNPKTVPYTRVTTFIGVLESSYNLQRWKQRMTAIGLANRPDLLLLVGSLGPQPEDDNEYKEWRSKLDEVCEQALEAAEASAPANIGTALHSYTDRIDLGLPLGKVPQQYQKHLKAYEAATAPLTPVHIERFVVNDQYQTGGTADRFSMMEGHNKLIVTDTKTGHDLSYGMGKFAMQKALYAHSQFYSPDSGEVSDIPNIDLERGLIIALNNKTGRCDLIWVDLQAGWSGVRIANDVRAWQKRKDFHSPYTPRDLVAEAHSQILQGIAAASTEDDLYQLWSTAGKLWLPEHTKLAATRKEQILNGHA